ncbi:MAG: NAD-dependent epimerase/dehydratase family protein, partial [Sinobacterium sp.]|nr:NAD-dependent epimerase/dehydratase family protein [Sinobacterium sp.]
IGDITDAEVIDRALDGCDAVVHTAAIVSLDPSEADNMMHTNLTGTKLVVGGAVKKGIKSIVYVSSVAALYNSQASVINEDTPLTEPKSAYAKSKRQCEEYVRELMSDGASIAITYPSAVVGPQDPALSECNLSIKILISLTCIHTTSGQQIIDVRDLASTQVKLLEQEKSGRYLITGHYRPWRGISAALDKATGKTLLKISVPRSVMKFFGVVVDLIRKVMPLDTPISREAMMYTTEWVYADDQKVRDELNITYRPIEDTLADTIEWMAESGHIRKHWAENIVRRKAQAEK